MKYGICLLSIIFFFLPLCSQDIDRSGDFTDQALRVEIYMTGNAESETVTVGQMVIDPRWAGPVNTLISGVVFGLTMGLAQWIVLRRRVKLASVWILLSIPGWTLGLVGVLGSILVGAVVGAITGFAFDFLLRFPRDDVKLKT